MSMEALFDAHAHLAPDTRPPTQPEAPEVIAAGRLLCGVSPDGWEPLEQAAAQWPGSMPAFGLHPWHVASAAEGWLEKLEEMLSRHPAGWLGETGLDGLKTDASPVEAQEKALAAQLRLARRLNRPVNLHCVKAYDRLIALLDAEYLTDGPRDFIVHSFGGPHQFLKPLEERGAYFSIGPLASRHDSRRLRARAALIPEDRLLLESDAFLHPRRDAAEDLIHTLYWLAECRQADPDHLARRIAENSRRVFNHA